MKKVMVVLAAVGFIASAALAKTGALSLVPNDAVTVGVIRLVDMRSSPISAALFKETDKVAADGDAEKFLIDAGLQPSRDIDVVMAATIPRGSLGHDADVLIAAEGRFNVDRLVAALLSRGATKKGAYILLPREVSHNDLQGALAFPDSHLALIGSEAAVSEALSNYASGGTSFATTSGLGRELGRIDAHATAWALVDVTRASRIAGGPHIAASNSSAQALNSALRGVSTIALWATDSGDSLKLGAFGLSSDTETLQLLEDTVRGALSAMRLAVQDKSPDLVSVLRRFSVARTDDSITISGTVPAETFRKWTAPHTHYDR
jgi:hypothetical protein